MAAQETTLSELGDMLTRVVDRMATKDDIADLKTEMMEQFDHVDKQFRSVDGRFRERHSELAAIRRFVDRLEEQGASNAGFAKEIDHALARIAAIEEHLGINKKLAA
jgi:hypothetical protein